MSKAPKIAAPDVIASCFAVNITIRDVDAALLDRLTTVIALYFSRTCAEGVVARNESNATILDLACKIRFDKCINKRFMIQNLRTRHICRTFPDGNTGNRAVLVDARPIELWDDSTVRNMCALWSREPWRMIYASDGKPAGRAPGLRLPLSFPILGLICASLIRRRALFIRLIRLIVFASIAPQARDDPPGPREENQRPLVMRPPPRTAPVLRLPHRHRPGQLLQGQQLPQPPH